MKWASLPLLALILFLPSSDCAVSQTPSTQLRQRVNENVLFLMGGKSALLSISLPTIFPWWSRTEIICACCLSWAERQCRM
jgi:hypothetical protein